jgi:hypothetical protein
VLIAFVILGSSLMNAQLAFFVLDLVTWRKRVVGPSGAPQGMNHISVTHHQSRGARAYSPVTISLSADVLSADVLLRYTCPCCHSQQACCGQCICITRGTIYKCCPARHIDTHCPFFRSRTPSLTLLCSHSFQSFRPIPFPVFFTFCPLHCWHGGKTSLVVSSRRSWSRGRPSWYVCIQVSDVPCSFVC